MINLHGTKSGKLYIKPEELFALKKVRDLIKKVRRKKLRYCKECKGLVIHCKHKK